MGFISFSTNCCDVISSFIPRSRRRYLRAGRSQAILMLRAFVYAQCSSGHEMHSPTLWWLRTKYEGLGSRRLTNAADVSLVNRAASRTLGGTMDKSQSPLVSVVM